jgi:hypothetical protein
MSNQDRRQLVAQAAIGVTLCFGAYMLLADGPRTRLQTARAEVQGLQAQVQGAESMRDRIPAITKSLEAVERESAQVNQMGKAARDERGLFAALMALAAKHQVRLDELNPTRMGPGGAKETTAKTTGQADVAVGYSMVAVGAYENIAGFLAAVSTELGYVAVRTVRLAPEPNDTARLVRATIETEHYSFDVSAPQPIAEGH